VVVQVTTSSGGPFVALNPRCTRPLGQNLNAGRALMTPIDIQAHRVCVLSSNQRFFVGSKN
jgi:hypothetical protein